MPADGWSFAAVEGALVVRYDLAVIGNDEAAFELLCVAGSVGQRAIAILPEQRHSAWLVSQALSHLVSQLLADRSLVRQQRCSQSGSPGLLKRLLINAITEETLEHIHILEKLGIDVLLGEARFLKHNTITVSSGTDFRRSSVQANNVVIGTGVRRTAMHRPLGLMPSHNPESLLTGSRLPRTLCLLGGDSFGAGMATLFSLFGVQTRLLASREDSCAMVELAEAAGVFVVRNPAELGLREGRILSNRNADVLDCRRVCGFTEHLGLPGIGVEPDEHGQLWCADNLETWCSGVFGIGEVVGFSSDASHHPTEQAHRILNRITHRIRRPHFLGTRSGSFANR
jgi:NAD(P) transhydrogenase